MLKNKPIKNGTKMIDDAVAAHFLPPVRRTRREIDALLRALGHISRQRGAQVGTHQFIKALLRLTARRFVPVNDLHIVRGQVVGGQHVVGLNLGLSNAVRACASSAKASSATGFGPSSLSPAAARSLRQQAGLIDVADRVLIFTRHHDHDRLAP